MTDWKPPNSQYPPPKAGEPPLHFAARTGDADLIRLLVEQGSDVNAVFDMGLDPGARPSLATPLMVAAGSGHGASSDTVRLLLELGADPAIELSGSTAVSYAADGLGWNYRSGGGAEILRILLSAGGKLPADPERANLALTSAAGRGDRDMVEILLEQGLDVNGVFSPGKAEALGNQMVAMVQNQVKSVTPGLDDSDVRGLIEQFRQQFMPETNAPFSFEIPLFCAASSGNAAVVQYLLDKGANLHRLDSSGRTALFEAGSLEVAQLLVDAGLSLQDTDKYGWSPLVHALRDGDDGLNRVKWFLQLGADVNETHDRGYSVFMSAVSGMDLEKMKILIAAGANPHAVSELGYNAFHAAVNGSANREESVRATFGYLKTLGVDINLRNRAGQTPLGRALFEGSDIEARVLRELGAVE